MDMPEESTKPDHEFDDPLGHQSAGFVEMIDQKQTAQIVLGDVLQQLADGEVKERRGELAHSFEVESDRFTVLQPPVDGVVNLLPVLFDDTARADLVLDGKFHNPVLLLNAIQPRRGTGRGSRRSAG